MVKTERILITGITGKSGNYLFEILDAGSNRLKKYEFGFAVRNEHKAGKIRQSNFRCVIHTGNLDNQPFIDSLFRNKGYNTLLNIAGIEYSLPLVKEAVNNGVTRLILVHTTGIYSKNRKLAEHCRQIEEDIKLFVLGKGVSLTILRPTMVYGNLTDNTVSKFIKMADEMAIFPLVGTGKATLQPVHYSDLGKAYYAVLMNPEATNNKEYILSGGDEITFREMIKTIGAGLGRKNIFVPVPLPVAYLGAVALFAVSAGRLDYCEKVQHLAEDRAYPHEEARADFGYKPVKFADGVAAEIREYESSNMK